MEKAIEIMQHAGKWMQETNKTVSKWWDLENINKEFLFKHAKKEEFYVCFIDKKPAGAAVLQIKDALWVHWLCVEREFAGKGIPALFFEFAEHIAKDNNLSKIRIDVNADELKLRNVYEKLGFKLIEIKNEDYRNTAIYQFVSS